MNIRVIATSVLLVRPSLSFPTSLNSSLASKYRSGSVSLITAAMSTSSSTDTKNNVRIVSYNLLSSKLAQPSHFTHSDPDHLEYENRLPKILNQLNRAMTHGLSGNEEKTGEPAPPTIFALQEVCYPFASELHTFFAQRGYHFVTGLYGRPFNGYMGVAIAYPTKDFETVNVDICRLSDERVGGWPREEIDEEEASKGPGMVQRFRASVASIIQTIINNKAIKRLGYGDSGKKPPVDPWKMSENRFNVMLTVGLSHRSGKSDAFSISNYHMPCAFFAPAVMNIHSEMAAKRVQDLAAQTYKKIHGVEETEKTIPHIFAGDFNIMPDSPHYKLLTTGKLDKSDPTYPPLRYGKEWKIDALPMDSAYALENSEPEFTNYAQVKDDDPFIGTLDYIFLSQKERTSSVTEGTESGQWWKVHGVQKLPSTEDSGGPFPNEKEPSDHVLIAADLELVSM